MPCPLHGGARRETVGGMTKATKQPNPFRELADLVGSGRAAARMMNIEKTRFSRLARELVPVKFDELHQARLLIAALRVADSRTAP